MADLLCVYSTFSGRFAERSEARAKFFGKELRLFPGRKVPALGELVEVNELGVRPLRPAPRSRKEFVGENAYGGRDNDALNAKERITLVFPIQTGPRERRIRQPGERDVVQNVISCEAFVFSGKDTRDHLVAARVVVEKIGRQSNR